LGIPGGIGLAGFVKAGQQRNPNHNPAYHSEPSWESLGAATA
jgi:hypothetical protein